MLYSVSYKAPVAVWGVFMASNARCLCGTYHQVESYLWVIPWMMLLIQKDTLAIT